jgi:hypothetical protein
MRELRLVSRQMHKLTEILAGDKNRLHKGAHRRRYASLSGRQRSPWRLGTGDD